MGRYRRAATLTTILPLYQTVKLRRGSMVVPQHPAESFAASNSAGTPPDAFWLDDRVVESLMVPLDVVMGKVLANRTPQRLLAEEDHPVEALGLD